MEKSFLEPAIQRKIKQNSVNNIIMKTGNCSFFGNICWQDNLGIEFFITMIFFYPIMICKY